VVAGDGAPLPLAAVGVVAGRRQVGQPEHPSGVVHHVVGVHRHLEAGLGEPLPGQVTEPGRLDVGEERERLVGGSVRHGRPLASEERHGRISSRTAAPHRLIRELALGAADATILRQMEEVHADFTVAER
jgi:hypothetical protein